MKKTSKWPLALRKTIARKEKNNPKRLLLREENLLTEDAILVNNTSQQSPRTLNPTHMEHWNTRNSDGNAGSSSLDVMLGLLVQLEECESGLKFVSDDTSDLEFARSGDNFNGIERVKVEDEVRNPVQFFSAMVDGEMASGNICCDEDVLAGKKATAHSYEHSYDVVPVATLTSFLEQKNDSVQNKLMEEIQMNINDNCSAQSWNDGTNSSSSTEQAIHDFQASNKPLSERNT